MIFDAPTITVEGMGRLKIYGIDFSAQTIDSPGTFTVSYIDKNNNLPTPRLSYTSSTNLRIGGFSLKGYAVSFRKTLSAEGESLLVVTYVDESFILDRYFVGLNSKHWNVGNEYSQLYNSSYSRNIRFNELTTYNGPANASPQSSPPGFMILVGSPIDPCLEGFNAPSKEDICNPCPEARDSNAENESAIDCEQLRSLSIFDVDYNFNELIGAISSKVQIIFSGSVNPDYRANYTGTLREVLQAWCSDLGFSFYYVNGRIVIYSISKVFTIPTSLGDSKTISKVEEESIQHRFNSVSFAHFGSNGDNREYNCSSSVQRVVCRPVTVADLIGTSLIGAYPSNGESNYYRLLETMITLSGYHSLIRQMVTWFDVYGIRNADDAEAIISGSSNPNFAGVETKITSYSKNTRNNDLKGEYTLPLLSMTIKRVFKQDSPEFKSITQSDQINETIKDKAFKSGAYFFVASRNPNAYTNKVSWENKMANNFIGKYYLRMYETYTSSPPNITACGGDTAQFYKQGVSSLGFGEFMPPISPGYENLVTNFRENQKGSKVSAYRYVGNDTLAKDSFILVERGSNWSPTLSQGTEIDELITKCQDFDFIDLGMVSNFADNINDDVISGGGLKFSERDHLYIGFELPSGFNSSYENGQQSIHESDGVNDKNGKCRVPNDAFEVPVTLGLRSTKTRMYKFGGYSFYMPAQGCVDVANNSGGYHVLVDNSKNYGKSMLIPKIEDVQVDYPLEEDVGKINVNYKDVSPDELASSVIARQVPGGIQCFPNQTAIRQYLLNYNNSMAYSNNTTLKKSTFEIMGLPSANYDMSDGLIDFSVRVSGQGVRSYLTFSNLADRLVIRNNKLLEFDIKQNEIQARNSVRYVNKNIIASNENDITIQ